MNIKQAKEEIKHTVMEMCIRDRIKDTAVSQLYLYAGIVLMVIPIVIIYILLQKRFIEGASRSGIVRCV